jgi:hypothetical protein
MQDRRSGKLQDIFRKEQVLLLRRSSCFDKDFKVFFYRFQAVFLKREDLFYARFYFSISFSLLVERVNRIVMPKNIV